MAEERRHRQLQQLANRQWGVLRAADLKAVGLTRHELQTLLDRAILYARYKGIYTYGTDRPPWQGVLLAAQWSCGADAHLTGATALGLAKVRRVFLGEIQVAVPRRTVRARQPPLRLIRVRAPPARVRSDGPLRFASVPDALKDLAAQGASQAELRRLITAAIHQQKLDHPVMRALIAEHAGSRGIATLRAAYSSYLPTPQGRSGLERSFDRGLSRRPRIPAPEPNLHIRAGDINWEVDRYWPEQKVAVELHGGGYHDAAEDLDKDTFKAAKLALLGIQVLAFTDTRWELEPEACLNDLEALLSSRGRRLDP